MAQNLFSLPVGYMTAWKLKYAQLCFYGRWNGVIVVMARLLAA